MIDTLIFDFGDVFINLDKQATPLAFKKLGLENWSPQIDTLNFNFEKGLISRADFLAGLNQLVPNACRGDSRVAIYSLMIFEAFKSYEWFTPWHLTGEEVLNAWNEVLLDFPLSRLEFLELIANNYQVFLLSNTDSIHINHFKEKNGDAFYNRFYNCFSKVYFSYDLGRRKPDVEIYKYVINENNLIPENTLFIDDNFDNIEGAKKAGLQVWHLQKGQEEVTEIFDKGIL